MSEGDSNLPQSTRGSYPWFVGIFLFSAIGIGLLFLATTINRGWCDQLSVKLSYNANVAQLEKIKKGEIDCLVQPDATLVDAIFSDTAIAEKIKTLYLGNDVTAPYLAGLKELPSLKTVVLLCAKQPDVFLERLSGKESLEAISLERCFIPSEGMKIFGGFPNLRSLCFPLFRMTANDLEWLRNHATLEKLYFTKYDGSVSDFSILRTIPRLRELTIRTRSDYNDEKKLLASLEQALPDCRVVVQLEER